MMSEKELEVLREDTTKKYADWMQAMYPGVDRSHLERRVTGLLDLFERGLKLPFAGCAKNSTGT